jgi:Holliday junction DNA helicase RuvB
MVFRLTFYTPEEIHEIVRRSALILNTGIDEAGIAAIAMRSRGTPRVANRLLKRVRDFAMVKGTGSIDDELSVLALNHLSVDAQGLDDGDRRILMAMIEKFNGGPVGIQTIAAACMEDEETIADMHEPYLMQIGFIKRTPKGRVITERALDHLGIVNKENLIWS